MKTRALKNYGSSVGLEVYDIDLDDENEKLKSELAKAKLEIAEIESRYLSCRQAAQRFIDTPPDVPSGKRQRVDSK
jgi:hypothetical protein